MKGCYSRFTTPILGARSASRRMLLRKWLEPLGRPCDANQERLKRDMIGSKIAKPAKNAVHPDSALTFGFYGGDHCRGAGDGERWPLKVSRRLYILIA